MVDLLTRLTDIVLFDLELLIFGYFLLVNSFYTLQLLASNRYMWTYIRRSAGQRNWELVGMDILPHISVLVPAHNEARTIADSLRAILTVDYPSLEVVVVNDGSTDDTLARLQEEFALFPVHPIYQRLLHTQPVRGMFRSSRHPHLIVVDKGAGGKADALNTAINVATGDLVCAIDADTLVESDALQRMVRPFLRRPDLMGCGGTVRVVNGSGVYFGQVTRAAVSRSPLAGVQTVEYLRAFLFGRVGWNLLGGNLIVSGAFGLFRRSVIVAAGGYLSDTVGEDLELVVRLRRTARETGVPDAIEAIPDPVAWTEVPSSLRVLARQRERWHRGLTDALSRHRDLLFNRKYGVLGMWVVPVFAFIEWLAPVVESLGIVGLCIGLWLGKVDPEFALLVWLLAYGWATLLSLYAVLLEDMYQRRYELAPSRLWLVVLVLLENFGYRQLTLWWRLRGIIRYLRGRKDWGAMERKGFTPAPVPEPAAARSRYGPRS